MERNETFALENPISKLTGKPRCELTREDIIKVVIEQQIERITFHYTGLDGKIKELRLPITSRRQLETILTDGERVDGSSLFKGIVDAGKSDLYVVPQYSSAFLNPFEENSLDFVCRFLTREGELAPYTPDNILHRAAESLKKNTGLELHALGELEFFMIMDSYDDLYQLKSQKGYHQAAPFVKGSEMLNEMVNIIAQVCGNVKYAHHEVGAIKNLQSTFTEIDGKCAEQVEVEFLPTPIEETADNMVLAKWITRNVGYRYNTLVTFIPKLEIGHAGNGMHFHTQLMKDGQNIMCQENGELSEDAKALIGGFCQYAPSLTAFGNQVPSSYLRLVPNQEAPTNVVWSEMNRSALIRVPLAWTACENLTKVVNPQQEADLEYKPVRQTVELRSPDGSAFVHLLLAGMTMAAEWGLTNKKDALDICENCHVTTNIHSSGSQQDFGELATSCAESSEKLLQVRSLYERDGIFPPKVISYFSQKLRVMNDEDLNNRLMSLTEEERHFQQRRIMHRDIYKH
jgi:glutamine synthetase